jgi:hypothetical protein
MLAIEAKKLSQTKFGDKIKPLMRLIVDHACLGDMRVSVYGYACGPSEEKMLKQLGYTISRKGQEVCIISWGEGKNEQ